jgi:HK97 gp10 family phage protein
MPMSLQTTGYREMQGKCKLLQLAVRDDATRDAVRAGASVILNAMQQNAPILDKKTAESNALEPGSLKRGLRISVKKVRDGFIDSLIGPNGNVAYVARWVEYGHRLVKGGQSHITARGVVGRGAVIGHVPAYPFLRPAFDGSWQAALAAFSSKLAERLKGVLR